MRRAIEVRPAGQWSGADEIDRVVLDADDRHRRRMVLTGEAGITFLLDLARATVLRDGDALVLDDGAVVRVTGLAESIVELSAPTPLDLLRLAWHLGNRHADVQIIGGKLRMRRDHVLEDMVMRLGAATTPVVAPFSPEPSSPRDHHGHDHGDHHPGHADDT
jgi:urease accessory protein